EVAVLSAADDEAVFRDAVELAAFSHEVERVAGAGVALGFLDVHPVHARALVGPAFVALALVLALDEALELRRGLQHPLRDPGPPGFVAALLRGGLGPRPAFLRLRHR